MALRARSVRTGVGVLAALVALRGLPAMAGLCAGVPSNAWCARP